MNKSIVFVVLFFLTLSSNAQKIYFIYLQTDNKQAFSVRINGKDLSSTASGYIIIPKLSKGEQNFTISFPKNEWPKQTFNVLLNDIDKGYILKNFSEKGWGLYNDQSMDIVMNGDPIKKAKIPNENTDVEIVKVKVPDVKVETPKAETVIVPEKVEEVPVVKVATKNADRSPVLQTNPEPEIVKTTPKIVEKTVDVIKEIPAPKVEEKVIETVKEVPAPKVEKKVVETIKEIPASKEEIVKIKETPVVKVEEKVVEKIAEKPIGKPVVNETTTEPVEEKSASKNVITKVSSFDDIDGITITYRVVSPSGVDIVPIFVEKNMVLTTETTSPKSGEKFIEHIELKNPNEEKVVEKKEDPTTAKVATNNANRAPIEPSNVEKVEVVEKPLKTEKVNQKEIIDYAEKIKKEEPVEEKKVEPIKIEKPVVEKVVEKKEEPVVKVQAPVITEKATEYGNNPLKITEAEKSSKTSRNITTINSDCADRKATHEDFFKTRKKMIADDSNEDAMVEAALKQFKLKCYSVEQIKNLALIFLTDEGKYKLLDAAYPYTHESNLYASLEPLFKEAYYIKRFKAMLDR